MWVCLAMACAAPSLSYVPDEPFRFVGGHLAADLVNTVSWETRGPANDRLSDYFRVLEWAERAGALPPSAVASLRESARVRAFEADAVHEEARWLREVLWRLFVAVARGELHEPGGVQALAEFNGLLHSALSELRLAPSHQRGSGDSGGSGDSVGSGDFGGLGDSSGSWDLSRQFSPGVPEGARQPMPVLTWSWNLEPARLDSVLRPVVWAAARLLASPDAARIGVCAGPECGWVFVDYSRNGLRRWCDMQSCGTRAKSRRRAARSRTGAAAGSSA